MEQRLIDKLIKLADSNPKGVFRATFFAKYTVLMNIEDSEKDDLIIYKYMGKEAEVNLITHENCQHYKCIITPGIKGIRIWEFLKALVSLATPYTIEPPTELLTAGQEAKYYIEEAKKYLQPIKA